MTDDLRSPAKTLCAIALLFSLGTIAAAGTQPDTPVFLEPAEDGQTVSGEDVHMVIAAFKDSDGDRHLCTDWAIVDAADIVVWTASCIIDPATRVHAHLGDGTFTGSLDGARALAFDTDYVLRARVRSDSGDAATEWSAWAERHFHTASASVILPLELDDVMADPSPRWVVDGGDDFEDSVLRLETQSSRTLLEIGNDRIVNPDPLSQHEPVRVVVRSQSEALSIDESDLEIYDSSGRRIVIALPAIQLAAQQAIRFWVSGNGSTYGDDPPSEAPQFTLLARGAAVPWSVPDDYRIEVFATGFRLPVDIAFVPHPSEDPGSPFFYVTELYGGIKVVLRDGSVRDYATNLLNFDPAAPFPGPGERGVTGLAVDESGDVYASMMQQGTDGSFEPRIVKLHSEDAGLTAASITTVLAMTGTPQAASHQISNITIGPDGNLYVHIGDALQFWYAQNPDTFLGKIIRLKPDGSPVESNPFYDASDGITPRDYVYALGFRNPFGGAWRAEDQQLYCVENGPSVDRLSRIVAGRNYLWNGGDDSMFNYALYYWTPAVAPVGIAFVQPETFGGSGFPAMKYGHAFVTESGPTWATGVQRNGKRIREFSFDEDGNVVSDLPFAEYTGAGHATAAGIAAGPDGLYFSDLYLDAEDASPIDRGSNIVRIRFSGSAHVTASPESDDPLSIRFAAITSVNDIVARHWAFGDGAAADVTDPVHAYAASGTYTVSLRVTTAAGKSYVSAVTVMVAAQSGTGLDAHFFADRAMTRPLGEVSVPAIDFDWSESPPGGISESDFTVGWSGYVEPRYTQTYTFETSAGGDVRLWIGDQLLVDDWIGHPHVHTSARLRLEAGHRYPIAMLYSTTPGQPHEAHLYWSSDSQPREIVPTIALYPKPSRARLVAN